MTGSGTVDHHLVARLEVAGHLHGSVGGQAGAHLDLLGLVRRDLHLHPSLAATAVTTAAADDEHLLVGGTMVRGR